MFFFSFFCLLGIWGRSKNNHWQLKILNAAKAPERCYFAVVAKAVVTHLFLSDTPSALKFSLSFLSPCCLEPVGNDSIRQSIRSQNLNGLWEAALWVVCVCVCVWSACGQGRRLQWRWIEMVPVRILLGLMGLSSQIGSVHQPSSPLVKPNQLHPAHWCTKGRWTPVRKSCLRTDIVCQVQFSYLVYFLQGPCTRERLGTKEDALNHIVLWIVSLSLEIVGQGWIDWILTLRWCGAQMIVTSCQKKVSPVLSGLKTSGPRMKFCQCYYWITAPLVAFFITLWKCTATDTYLWINH